MHHDDGAGAPESAASSGGVRHRVPSWLKWVAPAVLLVEAVLVITGALDLGRAVVLALVMEVVMTLVAVVLAATAGSLYRRSRRQGTGRQQALLGALAPLAPARCWRYCATSWASPPLTST